MLTDASPEIRHVVVSSHRLAYRELGASTDVPIVLFSPFPPGTEWDAAVLEPLSVRRRVIVIDSLDAGLDDGASRGGTGAAARAAIGLVEGLGLSRIDMVGYSLGGFVAQRVSLLRPDLVRHLVLAGTSSDGALADVTAEPKWALFLAASDAENEVAEAYFNSAYPASGWADAEALSSRAAAERAAIEAWWSGVEAVLADLASICEQDQAIPGESDAAVPSANAFLTAQRLPNMRIIVYPASGHDFPSPDRETFAGDVLQFLDAMAKGGRR